MEVQAHSEVDARIVGGVVVALVVVWLILGALVAHATLWPEDPRLPLERHAATALPERWAFFTLDARAPYPLIYRLVDDEWRAIDAGYRGNWLGFDRAIRLPDYEAQYLAAFLDDSSWVECRGDVLGCLDKAKPTEASASRPNPHLCGDIGLAVGPLTVRRGNAPATRHPLRVARLEVSC